MIPPRPPENGSQTEPLGDDLLSLEPTDRRINDDTRAGKK